jgi:hypothetical protein
MGEHRKVSGGGAQELNGVNRALRILGVQIDNYDFYVLILNLPDDRVGGSQREAYVAEYDTRDVGSGNPILEDSLVFAIFCQDRDGNAMHGSVLVFLSKRLHGKRRDSSAPSDLGNRLHTYATSNPYIYAQ